MLAITQKCTSKGYRKRLKFVLGRQKSSLFCNGESTTCCTPCCVSLLVSLHNSLRRQKSHLRHWHWITALSKVRSHQCIIDCSPTETRSLQAVFLFRGPPVVLKSKRALVTIFEEALLNHKHFLTWRHLIVETFRMIIKKKITFCSKDRSPSSRCRSQLFKKRCFWFSGCFRSNCRRIASHFFRSSSFTSLCCALQDLWVIPQYPLCLGSDWLDAQLSVALVSCDDWRWDPQPPGVEQEAPTSLALGPCRCFLFQRGWETSAILLVGGRWVADGWPMGMFSCAKVVRFSPSRWAQSRYPTRWAGRFFAWLHHLGETRQSEWTVAPVNASESVDFWIDGDILRVFGFLWHQPDEAQGMGESLQGCCPKDPVPRSVCGWEIWLLLTSGPESGQHDLSSHFRSR